MFFKQRPPYASLISGFMATRWRILREYYNTYSASNDQYVWDIASEITHLLRMRMNTFFSLSSDNGLDKLPPWTTSLFLVSCFWMRIGKFGIVTLESPLNFKSSKTCSSVTYSKFVQLCSSIISKPLNNWHRLYRNIPQVYVLNMASTPV